MLLVQIGIHYEGIFYEFVPWNGVVNFEVAPWGHWCMSAENGTHTVIGYILVGKKQFSFSPRIISVSAILLAILFQGINVLWKQNPYQRT